MQHNIRVSWLGSVYENSEPNQLYISLVSILKQKTNFSFEIVLVFDGKVRKEVIEITNRIKDKYDFFKIYRIPENGGLGPALNYGLSKCKGDLIARFDTDDVNHLDRLQTQVEFMDSNQEISVLFASAYEFISSEKKISVNCGLRKACPSAFIKNLMSIKNPIIHPTVMFRRKDIIKSESYPNQKFFEDYLLWLKMRKNNFEFSSIIKPLVFVRVDDIYSRRYSFSYFKYEISFIKSSFFKNKYISMTYLPFFVLRLIIRLIPFNSFQALLRKRFKRIICKNPDLIINDKNI